jgi:hypothetical protein
MNPELARLRARTDRMFAALAVILTETGGWRGKMTEDQRRAKLASVNRIAFEAIRDTISQGKEHEKP